MRLSLRMIFGGVFVAALAQPAAAQEAKTIVADLMTKGKGAFNDLKYKQADSLGRKVLSYSVLLTKEQKVEAMQLVVAASYPEDEGEQKADVAIDYIKQLITLGAKTGIPRELSWAGLDSLYAWVSRATTGGANAAVTPAPTAPVSAGPGQVRLGTASPEAFLYVNDKIVGPISSLNYWNVPGGEPVKLTIKSTRCMTNWDTTLTVASGTQSTIGRRSAGGCQ
jgi:hypothetical protein